MYRILFSQIYILAAFALPASADINNVQKWQRRADRLAQSCGNEIKKFCNEIPKGKEQYRCIMLKESQVSPVCKSFVARVHEKIHMHKDKVAREQMQLQNQQIRTPASAAAAAGPKKGG